MHDEQSNVLKGIRPEIEIQLNGEKNEHELFMHQTLRPILKMQHLKIIQLIENATHFDKLKCTTNSNEENTVYVKTFISKNTELKNQLLGLIIGLFTLKEFHYFLENSSTISKRITEMIVVRYLSSHS